MHAHTYTHTHTHTHTLTYMCMYSCTHNTHTHTHTHKLTCNDCEFCLLQFVVVTTLCIVTHYLCRYTLTKHYQCTSYI